MLLVEDNEDNRIIYATALRYAGYEVLEAITGTEGVQRARTQRPDLILMDISVPELDGWEATAILKADPATRHIPVDRGDGARAARRPGAKHGGRMRRLSGEADPAGDAPRRGRPAVRANDAVVYAAARRVDDRASR